MSTVRIQVRRGTASQWTSVNPILAAGELGVESDTNLFKFGNGSSTWTALSYANNSDVAIGEISQDAVNAALTMGAGLIKTYNDGANTITIAVDASYFNELAQDAVNSALTLGAGLTKTYNDNANTLTVAVDTSVIANKTYVDNAVSGLANTADSTYALASDRGIASGYASLDSNTFVPQAQILEPVQDIVAAMTVGGRGLNSSYNDTTGQLTLTPALSARNGILVEDVSNNGVGFYLSPTINAETKLTTPLVQAGTVSASTVNTGDITVSGNLTVNGTTTTVNSTNVSFTDPMIYMGDGNQSNALDLGFVAAFNNGTYQHSGLVRDASENKWVLFSGVVSEPTTTVDFSTYTKDGLVLGSLNATSAVIGSVTNSEIQRLSGVTSPIQTQINTINTNADTAAAALALKAPLASPTFTGTVNGITKVMVGLGAVDNTTDAAKPVSTATQTALDLKADSSATQTALNLKADLSSPTFTGTPSAPTPATGANTTQLATTAFVRTEITGLTKSNVGLSAVDNTSDAAKPVSSATQTALNLKANIASPTFTGTVTGITKSMVGLGSVDNTADSAKPISTATQTALDLKLASATAASTYAPIASPTFTGTVSGVTKSHVGLGNVDNTADSAKPVSTATQTALDLKLASATAATTYAPIASPTFTGTVSGITKSMVGLGSVDNTADSAKPVSTATQTALDAKAPLASPALTGVPTAPTAAAGTSTTQVATTAFVGTAVSALVASAPAALDTLNELATALGNDASFSTTITNSIGLKAPLASPTFTGTVSGITKSMVGLGSVDNTADSAKPISTAAQTALDLKLASATAASTYAPIASPTFTGTVTVAAAGVAFTDGTQTREGVPSRTTISQKTASYTLAALTERDSMIEMNSASATTLTVPTNATVAWPIGTSIDILRVGAGAVDVAAASGVTINATPGLKLRAQWSSATLIKRATDTWVLVGDLSA
jgi:hypothetical protein